MNWVLFLLLRIARRFIFILFTGLRRRGSLSLDPTYHWSGKGFQYMQLFAVEALSELTVVLAKLVHTVACVLGHRDYRPLQMLSLLIN